jgi:hypothetical protein
MRLSTRSKVGLLLSFVTILAIVGAFVFTVQLHPSGTHASNATSTSAYAGHTGALTLAHTFNLSSLHTGKSLTGHQLATVRPHILLDVVARHHLNNAIQAATRSGQASSSDSGIDPAGVKSYYEQPPGQILHNFHGLNSVDSFNANGFILEPPDQGLCVGSLSGQKTVFEIINDVVAAYTPGGTLIAGPFNLNSFFAEPAAEFMTDPRCYYDPSTNVTFFTSLAIDNTATVSNHIDVVALFPSGLGRIFRVDVTFANDTAGQCPCLGDQPKIGIDPFNFYVSVDQYGAGETLETGAALIAISKAQLISGTSVHFVVFNNLALDGIGITDLHPALTTGNPGEEFLLNSFEYADAAQTQPITLTHSLGLWSLSSPWKVSAGGVPTLTAKTITSETYGFPVPALTTNGKSLATFSNDSRMQQVKYINGHLLGALDSAVAINNDPVTRDGGAWFELTPHVNGSGHIEGASFIDQGYVASKGKYVLYPAIEQNVNDVTAMSFSVTSPTLNPTTGYTVLARGKKSFGPLHFTQVGSGPDEGFTCFLTGAELVQQCRWGDYSWTALDPNGVDFWMAAETIVPHVATQPNTNPPAQTNWGTQVWEVNGN